MTSLKIDFIQPQETYFLRHQVLRPHQPIENCHFPEDNAKNTFHVGAKFGNNLVCVASFNVEKLPSLTAQNSYRLRGMATSSEKRRTGAGRLVIAFAEMELQKRECDLLWFNARVIAFPFYESLGFQYFGDLFEIPEIGPHKVMYKRF